MSEHKSYWKARAELAEVALGKIRDAFARTLYYQPDFKMLVLERNEVISAFDDWVTAREDLEDSSGKKKESR